MKEYLETYVKETLERSPLVREDDFLLYCAVIRRMGVDTGRAFKDLMINHKQYELPSFESVSRCRRKIAETYPELSGNKLNREIERQAFVSYAIDKKGETK